LPHLAIERYSYQFLSLFGISLAILDENIQLTIHRVNSLKAGGQFGIAIAIA